MKRFLETWTFRNNSSIDPASTRVTGNAANSSDISAASCARRCLPTRTDGNAKSTCGVGRSSAHGRRRDASASSVVGNRARRAAERDQSVGLQRQESAEGPLGWRGLAIATNPTPFPRGPSLLLVQLDQTAPTGPSRWPSTAATRATIRDRRSVETMSRARLGRNDHSVS